MGVLQPLHELGVAQQVPVQWAVFGQGQVSGVLRQRGALVVALSNTARGSSAGLAQTNPWLHLNAHGTYDSFNFNDDKARNVTSTFGRLIFK